MSWGRSPLDELKEITKQLKIKKDKNTNGDSLF